MTGKHVLITGGSQGLGKALAELCVKRGARVTLVARTASKLQQACDELREAVAGCQVQHLSLDISSGKLPQVRDMLAEAARTFGRVDVFVANAGTGVAKLIIGSEGLDELLESQVSTNLIGGLRCAMAAAQAMASDGHGGRVSIVSSACGLISMPGYAIYSTTKFGHRGFLAGAYHEFRRHGVLLSVFYPGSIRTPGFEHEQSLIPTVTAKVEAQCSDVSSAEDCAAALLKGIESGAAEITNELLPALIVDHPTGCAPVDAIIAAVAQLFRSVWFIYLQLMSSYYISPLTPSTRASPSQPLMR